MYLYHLFTIYHIYLSVFVCHLYIYQASTTNYFCPSVSIYLSHLPLSLNVGLFSHKNAVPKPTA